MLYKFTMLTALLISPFTAYSQMIWAQPEKALVIVTNDVYRVSQVYNISLKHKKCILDKPNSKSMVNRFIDSASVKPVSYTHLTLPTIYSV